MNTAKSPLKLNLLWHTDFKEGPALAELLYHHFTRNPKSPFTRDMGIPMSMGTFNAEGVAKNISFEEKEYSYVVNILFLDNRIFIDDLWQILEKTLLANEKEQQIIIPVAFELEVLQLESKITNRQCIRLFEVAEARQQYFLLIHIAHELIRLLDNKICHDEKGQKLSRIRLPVKVFLSHAKKDGEPIAKRLREHVHQYFGVDTFFDANNIPIGSYFEEVLKDQVKQSIFLAIQTDEFSQSEWCTHELEWAKRHRRPIIILDLLQKGEARSYPYIGNVTTIRSTTENLMEDLEGFDLEQIELTDLLFDKLVLQILQEGLRIRYHETLVNYFKAKNSDNLGELEISPYPPELLTMVHLSEKIINTSAKGKVRQFIYPNPPIGYREEEIINHINQKLDLPYEFITPTFLLLSAALDKDKLKQLKVSVSISRIQDQPGSNLYVQDMLVEIAKALMHLEINLAYGGDLFIGATEGFNFTNILLEIARTYNKLNQSKSSQKIINYSAFPFYSRVDEKIIAEHHRIAKFEKVKPDEIYQINPEYAEEILTQNNVHTFFARAKCLTKMRKLMTEKTDARIVMGGQIKGFMGRYPGVIEEILLCMQEDKPVFLLGGFGGAATFAKQVLMGEKPEELTLAFHSEKYAHYGVGVKAFNQNEFVDENERIDYKKLVSFFNEKKSLADFGLNNQLSREENLFLFNSTNIYEIIHLILKGLNKIAKAS